MTNHSAPPALRLYVLNTGYLVGTDIPFIAHNGEIEIASATWFSGCYLIHHPQGWILWDTGLTDTLIDLPNGLIEGNVQSVVTKTLVACLQELGLTPQDIHYVIFSHAHPDHAGNITLFPNATLIIHGREYAVAISQPPPKGIIAADRWAFAARPTVQLWGDYDLFGDGTIRILEAPGHSVGHQVLLLQMPESGPVLISGDLFYSEYDRAMKRVAVWNSDRDQTLQSMARIDQLVAETQARLIIQHDQAHNAALPQLPAYLG